MDRKPERTVSQALPWSPAEEAILEAVGDHTRRVIFQRLRNGPLPVVDIARGLPVSRPAVSQHLKVLKNAGLVIDRPDANRRLYAVDPRALEVLRDSLDSFWHDALTNFAAMAEPQPTVNTDLV